MPRLRQLLVEYLTAYAPQFNPVVGWWADTKPRRAVAVHRRVGGGPVGGRLATIGR
jgi:hypothetical protein